MRLTNWATSDHRIARFYLEHARSRLLGTCSITLIESERTHCGARETTSSALRPLDDNMCCNTAHASYFIQLSSLRLVSA